jgi:hypothetical protein
LAKAKKKSVSPEAAAQAAAMKKLLEERAAARKQQDQANTRGANAGGGWAHGGVDAAQIRSGRRGNR